MKGLKLSLMVLTATMLALGLSGMAYAFHSGGVAECGGCHSMHAPKTGGSFLLVGTDQSSTCLSCHAHADTAPSSYHVMTYPVPGAGSAPVERTPGGDFGWLEKTYNFTVRGTATTEWGETHGHNVVAVDFGMVADDQWTVSPGGSFPTSQLACTSCHDPHGHYRRINGDTGYSIAATGAPIIGSGSYATSAVPTATQAVGVYRLLWGAATQGVGPITPPAVFPGVPAASAPSTYNQAEATNQVRVAYGYSATGSGKTSWGEWCGACHGTMHSGGAVSTVTHPTEVTLGTGGENQIYASYVSSGIMTGSAASSYLSLVPFIESTDSYTTLKSHASNTNAYLGGPATSDRVSCFSCHRAHASGFPSMLRWQMEGEFITLPYGGTDTNQIGGPAWPGADSTPAFPQFARGRLAAETQAAYYDRPPTLFGAYQRVLCNKCHAQD